MTETERTVIRRARDQAARNTVRRPRPTKPPAKQSRMDGLERANETLMRELTVVTAERDRLAETVAAQARMLEDRSYAGWVDAEREILRLRRLIAELEAA